MVETGLYVRTEKRNSYELKIYGPREETSHELKSIVLSNVKSLLILIMILLNFSFFILSSEIIINNIREKIKS